MKKIEFIWRHILYETIEKRVTYFQQQNLAAHFNISSSTVNAALSPLRRLGGVRVGGRGFEVIDYEKILYHWANQRVLARDIIFRANIKLPIRDIESQLPHNVTLTAYSMVRERFGEPPADYDKVYCYSDDFSSIQQRFDSVTGKGNPNLFVLSPDPFLSQYSLLPLSQLFVDLWNLSDWFAKDFVKSVKEAIDGLLS